MLLCPRCQRHVRSRGACPFCGSAVSGLSGASCPIGQEIDFITKGCAPSIANTAGKPPGVFETHLPIGAPGGACSWRCNWIWAGTDAENKAIASKAADCVGKNDKSGGWVLPTIRDYYQGKTAGSGEGAAGEEKCGQVAPTPAPNNVVVYAPPPSGIRAVVPSGFCETHACDPRKWSPSGWAIAAGVTGGVIAILWLLTRYDG